MSTRSHMFLLGLALTAAVLWWGRGDVSKRPIQRDGVKTPSFSATDQASPVSASVRSLTAVTTTPGSMNGALAEFLNMAKNPAIAADERENRIMALGRQADSEATRKLMALGDCARQVLEQMATIHSMDVVLPVKGNSTVTLRLVAKPEKMASDLLTHMQPRIPTRPKTIQNVVETFGAH